MRRGDKRDNPGRTSFPEGDAMGRKEKSHAAGLTCKGLDNAERGLNEGRPCPTFTSCSSSANHSFKQRENNRAHRIETANVQFQKNPSDRNRNDVLIDVTVASSEKKNSTLQSRRTRKLDSRFSSKDT